MILVIFSLALIRVGSCPLVYLGKLTLNMNCMTFVLISLLKSVFYVEECKELQCTSFEFTRIPLDPRQPQSHMLQSTESHHWFSTKLLGSQSNWLPRLAECTLQCFSSGNLACYDSILCREIRGDLRGGEKKMKGSALSLLFPIFFFLESLKT